MKMGICQNNFANYQTMKDASYFMLICIVILLWPSRAQATNYDVYTKGTVYNAATYSNHPSYFGHTDNNNVVDLNVRSGSYDCNMPIYAPEDGGTVTIRYNNSSGWGNAITWTKGSESLFLAHLSSFGKTGAVNGGDVIGYVGTTGDSTSCHLHIEKNYGRLVLSGNQIDPALWYNGYAYTSNGPTNPFPWVEFLPTILGKNNIKPPPPPDVGTVVSAGQIWMDRNLGASRVATSITDEQAYGDLYQWGRRTDSHEKRKSLTTSELSTTDDPGHGKFILAGNSGPPYDWRTPPNNNLWQGVSGTNNPCPPGFRLPTVAELDIERASWSSNNAAGAFASPLRLVLAGSRYEHDGTIGEVGSHGYYWSSEVNDIMSRRLTIRGIDVGDGAYIYSSDRGSGFSIRCIKD